MTRKELVDNIRKKGSFLCVGLDPDINKIPVHLLKEDNPIFEFNKKIIDATHQYAVAYKPNVAFYESIGTSGWIAFEKTIEYLKNRYPELFIIADAKRGDIGNTASMYAKSFFEHLDVDALTVAPYMGEDSVTPFLKYQGKWVILLALTSNKGSHDFQLIKDSEGQPLFEAVIKKSEQWGGPEEIMYVVGATQGKMFQEIRRVAPESFLLVPGVGAQGGSLEEVVKNGIIADCGLLINSSRGIIYASQDEHFDINAGKEAKNLRDQMTKLLKDYSII